MVISVRNEGSTCIVALSHPPVNALSIGGGVVAALQKAMRDAVADPAVTSIILTGDGRMFCGGADITDFDGDKSVLSLTRETLNEVEASPKPVVAAIHGMALGGGLELAMSAHYRVATKDARLGLPEVKLGILPGAGGTQRLPRLIGAERAIQMMIAGNPIDAVKAHTAGLVDQIAEGDIVAAALDFIAANHDLEARPTSAMPMPEDSMAAVEAARAKLRPGALSQAPARILDCVEVAANSSFEQGMKVEIDACLALMASEASLGLRHVFFGERKVAQIPGLPKGTKPRDITTVAIIGAGTMGTGIAISMLNAGLAVTLIDTQPAGLERSKGTIAKTIQREVDKGRLSAQAGEKRLTQLTLAGSLEAVAGADLIVEAVFEDLGVKETVFREIDRIAKPGAVLASNTSMLDLNKIAEFTSRPQDVIGLHFFSPANIMRLLEIVRGDKTGHDVLASAMALAKKIGKIGVVAGVCDGFIGNRMFEECLRQAYLLMEEGALPQQIDAALERWGMAMGPIRVLDLAGQDIGWSVRKRRKVDMPEREYSEFPDRICELGRFGQKSGKGAYLYTDGRTAQPDPEIEAMLVAFSAEKGIERREIADEEIVDRCILAMVNEGARIVAEGIAYRPVDIDVVFMAGYGFPAERGGPMFYADRLGLPEVLRRIRALHEGNHGNLWEPAPLLVELAQNGGTFEQLDT
jgi:3-hydroxyacyl-CoA dehydrogenase